MNQRGLTFIELIVSIVIVGIVLVGAVNGITVLVSDSAEPIVRQQALYIAESYLSEILAKEYRDPGSGNVCDTIPTMRANYDDVCDYRTLNDIGAHDQLGQPIVDLENFNINVNITMTTLSSTDALQVDVSVSNGNEQINLTGYRADY